MKFNGTWRTYQQRVLDHASKYLEDHQIHIVAAPGSGKTTLGIELVLRLNQPALILVPSVAIRQQWQKRIEQAFLEEGESIDELVSQDLKNPRFITLATYQAIHSIETDQLHELLHNHKIKTLCFDECHHLRNEWWKDLEELKAGIQNVTTIALTGTPPYDSKSNMWKKYIGLCGDIDEEITIPELVKDENLCPHQDCVYLSTPTSVEQKEISSFRERSQKMVDQLLDDDIVHKAVLGHVFITAKQWEDIVLEQPEYISSLLIYLNEHHDPYPSFYKEVLGFHRLPSMSKKWMEILLQKLLYEDPSSFLITEEDRAVLENMLKRDGFIDRRQVCLQTNPSIKKLLVTSQGKIDSILKIVSSEYKNLHHDLRMLILTDYIRGEQEKNVGTTKDVKALGAIPHFEQIRRMIEKDYKQDRPKLGVLCGSIVILPASAKEQFLSYCPQVSLKPIGSLSQQEYVKADGDSACIDAMTRLFEQGAFEILIGTKSLLGEGWDSPCVNSLILASFVGSYMLGNQMRGRALRMDPNHPQKTSIIWHLVCLDVSINLLENEEYQMLMQRMNNSMGLDYQDDIIINGIERLKFGEIHTKHDVQKENHRMLKVASNRHQLYERWKHAFDATKSIEIIDEVERESQSLSKADVKDELLQVGIGIVYEVLVYAFRIHFQHHQFSSALLLFFMLIGFVYIGSRAPKLVRLLSPYKRLEIYGQAVHEALEPYFQEESIVLVDHRDNISHSIYLTGGTSKDKEMFAQAMIDFFSEIDNQKYILVKKSMFQSYYPVPETLSRKKEDAQKFCEVLSKKVGKYELVYTRNMKGPKVLMKARRYALANRQAQIVHHKRMKGRLE